jgi:NAD(P)-dependent dehydrogenase (short-subunit alcohol dehydrogenase family)
VRVNAIAPGPTDTEGTAGLVDIVDGLGRTRALQRIAGPDEIARAVAFIASPAASYINGVVLPVDGGARALRPVA